MNHLQLFKSQMRERLFLLLVVNNLIIIADWWIVDEFFKLTGYWLLLALVAIPFLSMTLLPWVSSRFLVQPTKLLWQAILHIAPDTANVPAPDLNKAHFGKDLIANMISHIYQLASVADTAAREAEHEVTDPHHDFVATNLPLPLVILSKDDTIAFANRAFLDYIHQTEADVIGNNVYSVMDMAFTTEQTLDHWLIDAKANKVVATQAWQRVRINVPAGGETAAEPPQFDLAAYYNKNNPQGFETMLVLFDHTTQYRQDDQSMGFLAVAVHELRTPLTLLRGYIEAFEEELDGKVDPKLQDFMKKMAAAAQQLAAFVNNMLNVSRIENDQFELQLHAESWPTILQKSVDDMRLRAEVRGIKVGLEVDDKLPDVGVDSVSIYEVVCNLIDNAIKYSGESKQITVKAYQNRDGLVETTIQDFGVGIPESAMSNLFDKYYRNHRNRAQIGGTGLGLYLSKAIVNAHGGHIWVRSKEGQGSVFGFTILPYSQVADSQKTGDNNTDIVRSAHGWIKNHSLYRR